MSNFFISIKLKRIFKRILKLFEIHSRNYRIIDDASKPSTTTSFQYSSVFPRYSHLHESTFLPSFFSFFFSSLHVRLIKLHLINSFRKRNCETSVEQHIRFAWYYKIMSQKLKILERFASSRQELNRPVRTAIFNTYFPYYVFISMRRLTCNRNDIFQRILSIILCDLLFTKIWDIFYK